MISWQDVLGREDTQALLVIASLRGHSNDLSLPGLNLAYSCLRKVWGLQSGCLPFLQLGAGGADLCQEWYAALFPTVNTNS